MLQRFKKKFQKPKSTKEDKSTSPEKCVCKNCETEFKGNFCPECGQSIKEFERPFKFLIIDLTGNIFAFDTRFWKTFVAILLKPGTLTRDYVKGHRVRYMPPFRFYVFMSFVFFLLLSYYTQQLTKKGSENGNNFIIFGDVEEDEPYNNSDSLNIADELQTESTKQDETEPTKQDEIEARKKLLNEHPEIFFKQLMTNLSWAMFFLMPLYGFFLWIFYRKAQRYYITHFIMAINQHAFMFVVLFIVLLLAVVLPDFSQPFRNYLVFIIPVYFAIGHRILYRQKIWKIILKLLVIAIVYILVVSAVALGLIVLVALQNGIGMN